MPRNQCARMVNLEHYALTGLLFTIAVEISRLRSLRGFEFAWACGPPIDMKIGTSQSEYDQSSVDGKGLFTLWMK